MAMYRIQSIDSGGSFVKLVGCRPPMNSTPKRSTPRKALDMQGGVFYALPRVESVLRGDCDLNRFAVWPEFY
jgi:hypothetical protein